jgi:hypothetical protein
MKQPKSKPHQRGMIEAITDILTANAHLGVECSGLATSQDLNEVT